MRAAHTVVFVFCSENSLNACSAQKFSLCIMQTFHKPLSLLWEASSWWPLTSFRMGLGCQMSTPWDFRLYTFSWLHPRTPNSREGKGTRNIQPLMASELSNCAKMMKSQKKCLKNGISRAASWWTHQGSDEGHPGRGLVCSWVWLYIINW